MSSVSSHGPAGGWRGESDSAPHGLPAPVASWWREISAGGGELARFDPAVLADLPLPAARWLAHAIEPGTQLYRRALISQRGRIKIGPWASYQAEWLLAPPQGFVWSATAHLGPIRVRGYDRYTDRTGEMRWRLFGRVPLIHATSADITRSAAGRLASETCFLPTALVTLPVQWEPVDAHRAVALLPIGEWTHRVTITVAETGALTRVDLPRWGNPDGRDHREHMFSADLDVREITVDGLTIPSGASGGWWRCPDGCADEPFIRLAVDTARFQ